MSKIGRKPINIDGVKVEIQGQDVHYKGPKASGVYHLPSELNVELKDTTLYLAPVKNKADMSSKQLSKVYREWGLLNALLANQ